MDEAWSRAKRAVRLASANPCAENASSLKADLERFAEDVVERCRAERARARALEVPVDLSDEAVIAAAKWSNRLPLRDYDGLLHHVPRLVNVVTCAEAVPVPGSKTELPLDLHHIGARCSNAYFAPRRFSAVQLAFDWPRCRVLIFRAPGRLGLRTSRPPANPVFFFVAQRAPCPCEPVGSSEPCASRRANARALLTMRACVRVRAFVAGCAG